MSFNHYVRTTLIPEWKNYYINYDTLSDLIRCLKPVTAKVKKSSDDYQVSIIVLEEDTKLADIVEDHFRQTLIDQIGKFEDFLKYKIEMCLKPILMKIVFNFKNLGNNNYPQEKIDNLKAQLKGEVKNYYKEVNLVKKYLNLNIKIYYKLLKKYTKVYKQIDLFKNEVIDDLNARILQVKAEKLNKLLDRYIQVTETIFIEYFFSEGQVKEAIDELNRVKNNHQFTKKESFTFGLYLGSFLVSAVMCALLLIVTDFFKEKQSEFIVYQFPIFRGALVIYLYIFLLGVDVYVWEHFNINYKNVFNIDYNSSSAFQIMKRAFGFLAVWILTFSYCALSNSEYFQDIDFFNKDLSIFMSPFVWLVFILYLCFPSKIACNYEGRKHIFRVFKHIICLPFKKLTLQTNLEVDQVMSFLVVIKDLNYTVCYVKDIVTTHTAVNNCSGPEYDFTEMCIILFFLIWNFCPTLVDFFRTLLNKESMDEDEYSRDIRKGLYIIFRNIVSISCSGISYYTSNDDLLFYYWVYATIFVTLALFYADLVDEWGFLATKNLLREKLSYPKKGYYYIAIFMNFF
jgi:hypothetical protein